MYRVEFNGTSYSAPDLATLQQWANEGRILNNTLVMIETEGRQVPASEVPGLMFAGAYSVPPQNQGPAAYPRQGGYQSFEKVPNNLVLAIVATLCCCLPGGIVSIVYAAQVDGLAARGDIMGAKQKASLAKNWAIAAISIGGIINIIYLAIAILGGDFR